MRCEDYIHQSVKRQMLIDGCWELCWFHKLVALDSSITIIPPALSSWLGFLYMRALLLVEQVLRPIRKLLVTVKVSVPLLNL